MSAFYLTTPIYYVNAAPHLGHAYTTIVADAMARWRRLRGDRVWFLTGTDEHGDKISQAAAKAGVTPQAFADRNSGAFRETWRRLGITNDDFIRTTEARHTAVVQAILQRLWDAGEIYLGTYGGHYCFGCERFYTEKEIVGGNCPDHRTPLTWIEEENYFFRMSKYQGWLIEHVERHPDMIRPERYRNEILGFLRDPLQDLSISRPRRRLEWGIPLPFDDHYVTYVWFDALINYVSALDWPDGEKFRTFWPVAQHLIAKDILKPHAIYWPCMLKAAGLDVYRHLNVHGYWNVGGGKMSKSIGNVVEALALADTYGNDAFRYFVMREMTFGLDADFTEEALVGRLNAELANDLGNLVSRATTLIVNGGGLRRVPAEDELGEPERTIRSRGTTVVPDVDADMAEFAFQRALGRIWELVRLLNGYVDLTKPWELAKRQDRRLDVTLYTLGESLRFLGVVLAPFIPAAAAKIRAALGDTGQPSLGAATWGTLPAGTPVQKLSGLFPRVEDAKTSARREAASARRSAPAAHPTGASAHPTGASAHPTGHEAEATGRVSKDEFARLDLRVAEVLAAEAVPKSRKLLRLTVSLGTEQRTVVAGIAGDYAPADLVGKKVVIVANLEPVTLMGVESRGMILVGSASEGRLAVLTLDRDLPPGARVT
ncbi:MAG: methionine--tRNA ligase [Candidatus Rokubacteria bacterium]|nr:methionine--tRNA ligase [Candidatus Rokubacteria bacterium]